MSVSLGQVCWQLGPRQLLAKSGNSSHMIRNSQPKDQGFCQMFLTQSCFLWLTFTRLLLLLLFLLLLVVVSGCPCPCPGPNGHCSWNVWFELLAKIETTRGYKGAMLFGSP